MDIEHRPGQTRTSRERPLSIHESTKMMKGKTVFITGGAGFIGSTLARRLSSNNQVVIFDNLTRNAMQHTLRDYRDNIRFVQPYWLISAGPDRSVSR